MATVVEKGGCCTSLVITFLYQFYVSAKLNKWVYLYLYFLAQFCQSKKKLWWLRRQHPNLYLSPLTIQIAYFLCIYGKLTWISNLVAHLCRSNNTYFFCICNSCHFFLSCTTYLVLHLLLQKRQQTNLFFLRWEKCCVFGIIGLMDNDAP